MRSQSLVRSLFYRIAPTIVVTVLMIGWLAFHSATLQINKVYDAQLINNANIVWTLVENEINDGGTSAFRRIRKIDLSINAQPALNKSISEYAESRMFRVWRSDRLAMVSDEALPAEIPPAEPGFSEVTHNNEQWRIYALSIPKTTLLIEAGEKITLRQELVKRILLELFTPLLLMLPVIGLLLWAGIANALVTMRALIVQISKRSPEDLSHINLDRLPSDFVPLGSSVNQLLSKLENSFSTEKRFTDHAAHQLRTPLATIKLQLQLLEQVSKPEEQRAMLADLKQSTERASKLVTQLLTAARVSHQPIASMRIELYPLVARLIADLGPLVKSKKLDVALDAAPDVVALADETLLSLMLSNIIENAVKYTPEGGKIRVMLVSDTRFARCIVTDNGPGIGEHERALVFTRFYRVDTPHVAGTGLGLAIAAEVAARLGGNIALGDNPSGHGLMVEINLPRG
jgi:two-component system sensor histidine kinase QseC